MLISHLNINQGQQFAEIEGLARMIAVRVEDSDHAAIAPMKDPHFKQEGSQKTRPKNIHRITVKVEDSGLFS
jgi:hypothetical protein